jgi:hypothetical protein
MTPDFIEPALLRKHPEALERLLREALRQLPEGAALRDQMEVMLVTAMMEQHRFSEARMSLDSIIRRFPDNLEARFLDAELAFHMNDPWPSPWIKLESRWALEMTGPLMNLPGERWQGGELNGKRILLASEGRLGDEIQFGRFATQLKSVGARNVLVSTNYSLDPLLATIAGVDSCRAQFEPGEYDVWVPMLSVPGALRVTPETLPNRVPYLFPKTDATSVSETIGPIPGLRVGLCWRSGKEAKTLPLELFRALMDAPGLRVFALGEKKSLDQEVCGFPVVDLGSNDILGTAAAVQAMDLVVTVDTMMAHLAGALGKPVLLLLHRLPARWWGASGDATPWYTTMRLIRQQANGRWEPVIQRVAEILKAWAASGISDFLLFWSRRQNAEE